MSKMQEAWLVECKKFNIDPKYNRVGKLHFESGYQAAIAAVREGGPTAQIEETEGGNMRLLWQINWRRKPFVKATPLYKLPEDV